MGVKGLHAALRISGCLPPAELSGSSAVYDGWVAEAKQHVLREDGRDEMRAADAVANPRALVDRFLSRARCGPRRGGNQGRRQLPIVFRGWRGPLPVRACGGHPQSAPGARRRVPHGPGERGGAGHRHVERLFKASGCRCGCGPRTSLKCWLETGCQRAGAPADLPVVTWRDGPEHVGKEVICEGVVSQSKGQRLPVGVVLGRVSAAVPDRGHAEDEGAAAGPFFGWFDGARPRHGGNPPSTRPGDAADQSERSRPSAGRARWERVISPVSAGDRRSLEERFDAVAGG